MGSRNRWTGGAMIGKIDPAKDANDALAKLDDAEAGYAQMTKNQKSVAALYAKVAELDVGEMLRIWAGQQKAIAEVLAGDCRPR